LKSVTPLSVEHSDRNDERVLAPVWIEWGRLTRFLESARLAFAREHNLWTSLELRSADAVKVSAAADHGTHKVSLKGHLDAVRDKETPLASVLIHSYALAENAAAARLCGDARDFGGIEDWGTRLLATTGSTWDSLEEGLAGAVEVAVFRNAYAHGSRRVDASAASRLQDVGRRDPATGRRLTSPASSSGGAGLGSAGSLTVDVLRQRRPQDLEALLLEGLIE